MINNIKINKKDQNKMTKMKKMRKQQVIIINRLKEWLMSSMRLKNN